MPGVAAFPLPRKAILKDYATRPGHYTDCFATEITGTVSLPEFVEAFYTTPLFRAERVVLRVVFKMPSTDAGARDVAHGRSDRFAAWRAVDRRDNQLLMKAVGRTASWFMVEPVEGGTRLLFGSVVAPSKSRRPRAETGPISSLLLGAHRIYSRCLLAAARRRLQRVNRASDSVAT